MEAICFFASSNERVPPEKEMPSSVIVETTFTLLTGPLATGITLGAIVITPSRKVLFQNDVKSTACVVNNFSCQYF